MRRKLPSLQALACLDAAVRHESYTRAADELALTQGAVSRQIAALEAWVGAPLFRRTRHGVVPTPAGAAYARQVARHLDGLERVTLDAMSRDGLGGSLQLAVVPSFATRWLIPRLGALAAQAPELTVHVDVRTRPFLFADTPYDAAIHAGTPEQLAAWAGTRATPLLAERVLPVASPALLAGRAAITPAELATLPLLQAGTRPEAWRQWFEARGVDAPEAMRGPRYELFSMLVAAACHGLGAALVPQLLVEDELARGELRALHPEALPSGRIYSLVVPERAEAAPLLQRFADWLVAQAAAEAVPDAVPDAAPA